MTKNEQRPRRKVPTKGEDIINVSVTGQDKGNKNSPSSKKNCNYLTTQKKVFRVLRVAHTIDEVASELGISYQTAYYHLNKLCKAGKVTSAGYFRRKADGRIVYHYQDASIYYRIHPEWRYDEFYKKYRRYGK